KVQKQLSSVPHVRQVTIDLQRGEAQITMDKHIETSTFQEALKDYPNYQLTENHNRGYHHTQIEPAEKAANSASHGQYQTQRIYSATTDLADETEPRTWLQTYKPILLVFGYILAATLLVEIDGFN